MLETPFDCDYIDLYLLQAVKAAKIAKLEEQTKLKESHPYHPKRVEEAMEDKGDQKGGWMNV